MSSSRLRIILVCAVLAAIAGIVFQAYRISGSPQLFKSMAKLITAPKTPEEWGITWRDCQPDFYGTLIATLEESTEMKSRARERVEALNPELKEAEVTILADQIKGTGIVSVVATGTEPKYTRVFLDAVLDEYIGFRQEARISLLGPWLRQVLDKAAGLQKAMKESEAALERAKVGTSSPNANSELRVLAEKSTSAKQAYDRMFEQAEKLQNMIDIDPDAVAVIERASPAFEIVEDWMTCVAIFAAGGGPIGLVLSLLLVRSPKPPQIPAAL